MIMAGPFLMRTRRVAPRCLGWHEPHCRCGFHDAPGQSGFAVHEQVESFLVERGEVAEHLLGVGQRHAMSMGRSAIVDE
jgi:hypothetical protein